MIKIILKKNRKEKDKKGGGLMLIYKWNKDIEVNKLDTKPSDILYFREKYYWVDYKFVIVFWLLEVNQKTKWDISK